MTSAVDGRPVRVHFQPIVELATMRVVGFEALARFADGRSPLEHLAEAATQDARPRLERDLVSLAIATAVVVPLAYFVTINASARVISALPDDAFPPARRWGVELSESSEETECDRVRGAADRLRCLLLVDDAGTGFSDEERIRTLMPDVVKLDRSLLATSNDGRLADFARAAKEVGARTLAEGVERTEDLGVVRRLGLDLAQGYLFGAAHAESATPEAIARLDERLARL